MAEFSVFVAKKKKKERKSLKLPLNSVDKD